MQNEKNTSEDGPSTSENIQHGVVDHSRVVERAHHKFLARGGDHGRDMEDWLEAEAELRQEMTAGHGSENAPTAQCFAPVASSDIFARFVISASS